ncbi:hypothetical protein CCYA_CCYA19G4693 [Cyanidiococcus yangmingshanensis]|nr:hypothetical protein CCYA_CCYA19G4693 [Cyanidiococcus yangmingshanensis]
MPPVFYACFFVAFPVITVLIDLSLLFPERWPPRSLALLRETIQWWANTYDPLMVRAPVWLKAMTLVEVVIVPAYSVLALRALRKNKYAPWMVPLTIVFSTVCIYSVFIIAAENMYGLGRSLLDKDGIAWLLAYAPFFMAPLLWTVHVLQAVANRGAAAPSRKIMASISKRLSNRMHGGDGTSKSARVKADKQGTKTSAPIVKSARGELRRRLTPTTHEAQLLVAEADMRTPITTRSGARVRSTRGTTVQSTKTKT